MDLFAAFSHYFLSVKMTQCVTVYPGTSIHVHKPICLTRNLPKIRNQKWTITAKLRFRSLVKRGGNLLFFPVVSDVKIICLSGNDIYLRHEIRGLPYKQSSSNAGATLSAHTCKQGYPECFRNQHFDLNPNTDCMQT